MFNDVVLIMFVVWWCVYFGVVVIGWGKCDGIYVERKSKYSMYLEINMMVG